MAAPGATEAMARTATAHSPDAASEPARTGDRIVTTVLRLLGGIRALLFQLERESGELMCVAAAGKGNPEPWVGLRCPSHLGVAGRTVTERRLITTPDLVNDPAITLPEGSLPRILADGFRACVALPLVSRGEVLGALFLGDGAGRVFTDEEFRLLTVFADHAVTALESARERREGEVLAELTRDISASLDLDTVLQRVAQAARELCAADLARIALPTPGGETLRFHYVAGAVYEQYGSIVMEPGQGVGGLVLVSGRPWRTDDYVNDPRISKDYVDAVRADGLVAVMGVPIRIGERIEGVVFVDRRAARGFTDRDEAVLQRLADHAALAIRNARLHESTEQRLRETEGLLAELKATQAQLIQGETLRGLGKLASGAAHHLNNLLAVVWGRVQLVLRNEPAGPTRRSLETIEKAAKDAANVVHRLQQFARSEASDELQPLNVNEVVAEALEMTRVRWLDLAQVQGIPIDVEFHRSQIPLVLGDTVSLREAVMNVVLNAVEALPAGGRITVATRVEDGSVEVEVSDSGVGMSSEVLRRAPEPFFTTKGVKSTGLGLSLTHGVVQRHGGELVIESASDQGTAVTLRLPAVAASPDAAVGAGGSSRRLRILVVDDAREVCEVLAAMLTDEGHAVLQAGSGAEAMAALEQDAAVDLVLTDLGMPEMNGYQLAEVVRARWPRIKIGIITGWGSSPEAIPAGTREVDFVLGKPFPVESLLRCLDRLEWPVRA